MFIPLCLSKLDKHNKNPVKSAIHNLKDGLSKIGHAYETGVLAYHYKTMEYLCDIKLYVSRVSLNNLLRYESFWG